MSMKRKFGVLGASTFLATTMMVSPAWAQSTAPEADATTGDSQALEEITVTARKRAESIIQAPITITALSGEMLETRGVEDRRDLNRFTPGFKAAPQNTSSASRLINSYQMRGLGTVNLFWNGVPVGGGDIPEMLDLERVEVLKGPQNAYFGRSTFSGAINFLPKMAGFETEGYIEADLGSYETRNLKGGVQGTLIDGVLAGRIAGDYRYTGGQYKNFGYGGRLGQQETIAGSGSLLFTPTDKLKIKAYGSYWEVNDGPNAIAYLQASDYNCNGRAAPAGTNNFFCGAIKSAPANRISQLTNYSAAAFDALVQDAGANPLQLGTAGFAVDSDFFKKKNGLHRVGLMTQILADYELPWGVTASIVGAYNKNQAAQIFDYGSRFYDNPATFNPSATAYKFEDKYGEFRLTSDGSKRLRLMGGVSYVDSTQIIQSDLSRSGVISVSFPPTDQYSKTLGFFGSVSFDVIDKLTITAEGRWQDDKVGRSTRTRQADGSFAWISLEGTTKSFVPRVIAQYHVRPNLEVFASYSEGSSPGSLNSGFLSLPAYAQEQLGANYDVPRVVPEQKLENWEGGIKGTFFDGTLRILASVYKAKWTLQPYSAALFYNRQPDGVLTQANVTLGSGSTDAKGVELEMLWAPTRGLTIDSTFGYNDTKILSAVCAACAQITGVSNTVGARVARFPSTTASLGITYRHDLTGGYEAFYRIDANYQGREYADLTNLVWLDPYIMSNARIGVDNGHRKIELYVINLFDNDTPQGIAQTTDQISTRQTISLTPAMKRTWGVRVGVKF